MREFASNMPKLELHLHLEGAIPMAALWSLLEKYGCAEVSSLSELEARFRFSDFAHFIETWIWKSGFLRQYEDFETIAKAVALDLAAQNIRYVEAFFSPGDYAVSGLDPVLITDAVVAGVEAVSERIDIRLIADLNRNLGPERGMEMLEAIAARGHQRVIGIGLGGMEQGYPPEPYEAVFRRARALGLRTTAHAGEAEGPASVWGALRSLEVERIGHGIRAIDDPSLLRYLKQHQIPLEVCPISNLRTRVVDTAANHPVKRFIDEGLCVTISTDDPKMFNNSLADELVMLHETFGLDRAQLAKIMEDTVAAAWCEEGVKQRLRAEIQGYFQAHT